jgi:hypothetical protein
MLALGEGRGGQARPERDVFIVGGVADDGWAGLKTRVVET